MTAGIASERVAIIDGEIDEHDANVVVLLRGERAYCSGVLIGPRVVVTAAHCIDDLAPTAVQFGTSPRDGGPTRDVVMARQHPDAALDVGALLLAEDSPPDIDFASVETVDLNDVVHLDQRLRVVGYGSELDGVFKREGHVRVTAISSDLLITAADPEIVCHGDSGGPALVEVDGQEHVVGIASMADGECETSAVFTRVDRVADDFLRHFPEPASGSGERCAFDDNCVSGSCIAALQSGAQSYCSDPCGSDSDCSEAEMCVLDTLGQAQCRPSGPEPGILGLGCEHDAECASGYCEELVHGGRLCTLPCTSTNVLACPTDYACRAHPDDEQSEFCVPSSRAPDCSVAVGLRPGDQQTTLFATMLALLCARRSVTRARTASTIHRDLT